MFERIDRLHRRLAQARSLDVIARVVCDDVAEGIPASQSVVFFALEDEHKLKAIVARSPYAQYIETLPVRNNEGIFGMIWGRSDQAIALVTDTRSYGLHNIINYERAVLVAGLFRDDRWFGVLYVGAKDEDTLTTADREFLEYASIAASMALARGQLG